MNNLTSFSRRKFLEAVAGAAAAGAGFGFTSSPEKRLSITSQPRDQRFVPVNVSSERVIRTIVGLRPFRPSGFVVRAEKIEKKTIIHNYGHGGAGITLSWGTAKLAVDLALQTGKSKFGVIGCGVNGLSTARLLQQKGFQVTIYTKDLPPDTTSNIAGGLWFPTTVFKRDKADANFLQQFDSACRISHRMFQNLIGDEYGVRWLNYLSLGIPNQFLPSPELYPDIKEFGDYGYDYIQQFSTMVIEPATYLNALIRDFHIAGGKIVVTNFESAREINSLKESVLMNCTGLGAGKLFNDKEIMPIRGQLNVLIPQPEIDYCYSAEVEGKFLYMIPRKDGIVLGGTFQEGNWSTEPSASDSDMIINGHKIIARSFGAS